MLKLINTSAANSEASSEIARDISAENHHEQLIEGYLASHRTRNHASATIAQHSRMIRGWFAQQGELLGQPLYTWLAMEPISGRRLMQNYTKLLLQSEISAQTVRSHLNILNQYFSYVMAHP